jgi:N-glycosylase/DNA lyase
VGDTWTGVDGENWYSIQQHESELSVRSNADKEQCRVLLGLDQDIAEVHRDVLARGPEMAPYIEALPGLRVLRPSCPVEVLFCFLCTANNHLSRIGQMVRKLAAYGEPLAEMDGVSLTRFPALDRIAAIPEQELRQQGFGYRAATIPGVARQILEKTPHWLSSLQTRPYLEAREELLTLKSVGPKLADCICLYGLHHTDSTPIDTHLWQALTRLYFPEWQGKALTEARYNMAAAFLRERFGKHAGFAHLLLYFENLQNWRTR